MTKQEILDFNIDDLDSNYGVNDLKSEINSFSEEEKEEIILNFIDTCQERCQEGYQGSDIKLVLRSFQYILLNLKQSSTISAQKEKEEREDQEKAFNRELNIELLNTYTKEEILDIGDLDKIISSPIKKKVLITSLKDLSEEDIYEIIENIMNEFFPIDYIEKIRRIRPFVPNEKLKIHQDFISDYGNKISKLNSYLNFFDNNSIISKDEFLKEIYKNHNEYSIFINKLFDDRINIR